MRGKGRPAQGGTPATGITPACAGKSCRLRYKKNVRKDHPRVCGEKLQATLQKKCTKGSPPRVRGKADSAGCWASGCRITPACAGKSHWRARNVDTSRDHPRVCGEKFFWFCCFVHGVGSPPRVRGKECAPADVNLRNGITPACAGKSSTHRTGFCGTKDHPRVCGEKAKLSGCGNFLGGSPPRVRGKVGFIVFVQTAIGITPACAGKRSTPIFPVMDNWDHPRVCGEKAAPDWAAGARTGSPPRVRGKAFAPAPTIDMMGITPACAGKRRPEDGQKNKYGDHPRVCGEKFHRVSGVFDLTGSPPRVRGKAALPGQGESGPGITPACAGKRVASRCPVMKV